MSNKVFNNKKKMIYPIEIIRKKTIALGYREEGEEGKKVVKFKSLYVSPSYITGLIPNV